MPIDPILFSGPSITHAEIEYAASATATGWNMQRSGYINAFQSKMAQFVGQKYAFATSSSLGAMHLALLVLGVGQGDEVLVPEIADISVAFSVIYAGGRPVFCDVDPETLCLCPKSVRANITPRSKVIVPVHLYGQPCDMAGLREIAAEHKLFVLEHATQGLGSICRGRPAGSLGHFSVFGFGADDAVVAGEGGMLLSSNQQAFDKAVKLGNLGRSAKNPFVYENFGYNYAMSNVQAAMGFAQMERVEELLARKRQIFNWYKDSLEGVAGIRLNAERADSQNSFLMTTLIFEDPKILRHQLLERLLASKVICQPVFYPLSSMPMFKRVNNPVAYSTGLQGIVLPSAHNRTKEEIEYIASVIKELLVKKNVPVASVAPTGWLKYKADLLKQITEMKNKGLSIAFEHGGEDFVLRSATVEDVRDSKIIAFLAKLRQENIQVFLTQLDITEDFMKRAMSNYMLTRDYVLFFLLKGEELLGHIALDDFDFKKQECVADNVIILPNAGRGVAAAATDALYAFAKEKLGVKRVFNHVLASNTKVRLLASSQDFKEVVKIPLYKAVSPEKTMFRPMYIAGHDKAEDYFVFSAKDL